jgi:hypothetical protein
MAVWPGRMLPGVALETTTTDDRMTGDYQEDLRRELGNLFEAS